MRRISDTTPPAFPIPHDRPSPLRNPGPGSAPAATPLGATGALRLPDGAAPARCGVVAAACPTQQDEAVSIVRSPGMCAGFAAGSGDRTPGDLVTVPDEDFVAVEAAGRWRFLHRDGSPHPDREQG